MDYKKKSYKNVDYSKTIEEGFPVEERHTEPLDYESEMSRAKIFFRLLVVIMLGVILVFVLTGCSQPATPEVRTIYKTETKEVKVPVIPKIPELYCEFDGPGLEPTKKLLSCLIYHKRVLDILRTGKVDLTDPYLGDRIEEYIEKNYSEEDDAAEIGKILKTKKLK